MAFCKGCAFYTESFDNLNRDFNDVGDEQNHYCPMYQDAIPDGVYDGEKECQYYERRE